MQEYVTHFEKKLNKHDKVGNFATHSKKEFFLIHPLCDDINDFDDCKSFTEKNFQE